MRSIRLVCCLVFVTLIDLAIQFSIDVHAAEPRPDTDSGEIAIRAINAAGVPQADAIVSLFVYDSGSRTFKTTSREAKTDSTGLAHVDQLSSNGLSYPTVVDQPDGRILASYKGRGFQGFPSFILIGPDGRVIKDDQTVAGPDLFSFKTEIIRQQLMAPQAGVGAALRIEKNHE
jgi:hypothetical protein